MDEDAADTTMGELERPITINPTTKRPWTDEEREEKRALAKRLVAEGKMGGLHNGRRKKIPAYAVIAAEAQKNGRELARTLVDIARHGDTQKLKMDAIKMLTDIEQKSKQERRDEEDHFLKMPRDELLQTVLDRIEDLTGESYDIELGPEGVEDVDDEPAQEGA